MGNASLRQSEIAISILPAITAAMLKRDADDDRSELEYHCMLGSRTYEISERNPHDIDEDDTDTHYLEIMQNRRRLECVKVTGVDHGRRLISIYVAGTLIKAKQDLAFECEALGLPQDF
jgi:hypothetical protein